MSECALSDLVELELPTLARLLALSGIFNGKERRTLLERILTRSSPLHDHVHSLTKLHKFSNNTEKCLYNKFLSLMRGLHFPS